MSLLQIVNEPENQELFQWFDKISLNFIYRLLVDLVAVFILIRLIYFKNYKKTDLFLTFFGFNLIIFMITYLLNKVEMSLGAAFGLFAVFSMLRYRTEGISAKDMTYLFIVIALGLINAVSKGSWDDLAVLSGIIILVTALLESGWLVEKEYSKIVHYDNIDLITLDKQELLINDLKTRTGLNINRVEISEIDFLKDAATLTIYYHQTNSK
jgi:hypothetical protein